MSYRRRRRQPPRANLKASASGGKRASHAPRDIAPLQVVCEKNATIITISTSIGVRRIGAVEPSTGASPADCDDVIESHGQKQALPKTKLDADSVQLVNVEHDNAEKAPERYGELVGDGTGHHCDEVDGRRELNKATGSRERNEGKSEEETGGREEFGKVKENARVGCEGGGEEEEKEDEGSEEENQSEEDEERDEEKEEEENGEEEDEEDDEEDMILASRLPRMRRNRLQGAHKQVNRDKVGRRQSGMRGREEEGLWAKVQRVEGYEPHCHAVAATAKHAVSENDEDDMMDEDEMMREELIKWWTPEVAAAAGVEVSDACSVNEEGEEGKSPRRLGNNKEVEQADWQRIVLESLHRWDARMMGGGNAGSSRLPHAAIASKNGHHDHLQQHHQQQDHQQGVAVLRRDGRRVRQRFEPEFQMGVDVAGVNHRGRRGVEDGMMEWGDGSASLEERENGRQAWREDKDVEELTAKEKLQVMSIKRAGVQHCFRGAKPADVTFWPTDLQLGEAVRAKLSGFHAAGSEGYDRWLPHCCSGLSGVLLGCRRKCIQKLGQIAWGSLGYAVIREREREREKEREEERKEKKLDERTKEEGKEDEEGMKKEESVREKENMKRGREDKEGQEKEKEVRRGGLSASGETNSASGSDDSSDEESDSGGRGDRAGGCEGDGGGGGGGGPRGMGGTNVKEWPLGCSQWSVTGRDRNEQEEEGRKKVKELFKDAEWGSTWHVSASGRPFSSRAFESACKQVFGKNWSLSGSGDYALLSRSDTALCLMAVEYPIEYSLSQAAGKTRLSFTKRTFQRYRTRVDSWLSCPAAGRAQDTALGRLFVFGRVAVWAGDERAPAYTMKEVHYRKGGYYLEDFLGNDWPKYVEGQERYACKCLKSDCRGCVKEKMGSWW